MIFKKNTIFEEDNRTSKMQFSLIFRQLLATRFSSGGTILLDHLGIQVAPPHARQRGAAAMLRRASPGSSPGARLAHRALPYPATLSCAIFPDKWPPSSTVSNVPKKQRLLAKMNQNVSNLPDFGTLLTDVCRWKGAGQTNWKKEER